jgi:hypothetical protein
VRFKIIRRLELDGVRRHNRQAQAGSQGHRSADVRLVRGMPTALQLNVETPREKLGQLARPDLCLGHITIEQRLANDAQFRPSQANQTLGAGHQRVPLHPSVAAQTGRRPGLAQQLTQTQVTLLVLDQQQQARRQLGALFRLKPHIGTDDGLNAFLSC